jgi:hypothetical protein
VLGLFFMSVSGPRGNTSSGDSNSGKEPAEAGSILPRSIERKEALSGHGLRIPILSRPRLAGSMELLGAPYGAPAPPAMVMQGQLDMDDCR